MDLSLVAHNAMKNPNYCPYCLRCLVGRMSKVEPFLWKCSCGAVHDERRAVAAHQAATATPEPMDLFCPACGLRHVDEGVWATSPHKTHRCVGLTGPTGDAVDGCGHEWRPHDHPTVGRPTHVPTP